MVAQTTIPATGHKYSTEWTIDKEPTCTEEGSKSHHCTVCGDKADITAIERKEHNYSTTWTIDKAATCTSAGSKSHHCIVCGCKTDELDFIERLLPFFEDEQVNIAYGQSEIINEFGEHSGYIYTEYTNDVSTTKWSKDYVNNGENEIIDGASEDINRDYNAMISLIN